jgi:hypothetical protein
VIYPMNALANSQMQELNKFLSPIDGVPAVTFARYTGQESTDERQAIKSNPPDILLTNFMMLELLMTRQSELDQTVIRNCQGLNFVVLDELHTYRGRQPDLKGAHLINAEADLRAVLLHRFWARSVFLPRPARHGARRGATSGDRLVQPGTCSESAECNLARLHRCGLGAWDRRFAGPCERRETGQSGDPRCACESRDRDSGRRPYPLDFVRHYDPAVENAGLVGAAAFLSHPRRQLFANAAIAASRVAA